ncbi:cytochrome c [Alcaligenaceae bacterium]|nr:cytochrome c [Alcaligenaceae bacterium]
MAAGSKLLGLLLCAWLPLSAAQAADVAAGKAKSMQCAVCHGPQGIAISPDAPNLAGQNPIYLVKALNDFKSGARKDETMSLMAASLSDADIENLAAFYASLGNKP